jgi:hypothetical protein
MSRLVALLALLAGAGRAGAQTPAAGGFDHARHAKLFPTCTSCHEGAGTAGPSIWPTVASCAECHDGQVQPVVRWAPRAGRLGSNLKFDHARHREVAVRTGGPDRVPASCAACHNQDGTGRMQITRTALTNCLSCHQIKTEHVAAADSNCATCHTTLAESRELPDARIRKFPVPPSHKAEAFLARGPWGHGTLARPKGADRGPPAVAASCATCHAREFCITCHVNAPETATIQALAADQRSTLIPAKLTRPATHTTPDFGRKHGSRIGGKAESCATCHTRESCLACHQGALPRPAAHLALAGAGRGAGAQVARQKPASHTPDFKERHGPVASAMPSSCAACHARTECLDCHRPVSATGSGFHPAGFVVRHPSAAYTRETSCADCHNPQQFCQSCHASAGLGTRSPLGTNQYHDAKRFFLAGHGQAARQNLESCVTCHVERDCMSCHSAILGRRFNPHGPGFDAARLRRKNPETCLACHGGRVP